MAVRTKVTRKIEDIPRADWDQVYPDVVENYDFFKTLDESDLEQFKFYYLMVYDHKKPIGATACFLMNYSFDTSMNGPLRCLTNSIKSFFPQLFSLKALICGMPIGEGRLGISGPPDVVVKAILRGMERIAKKNKAPLIAFKDFDQTHTAMLDPLRGEGFDRFDGLPYTKLPLSFKNFEDYLKSLSGASRYDLRRKFKKVDQSVTFDHEVVDSLEGDRLDEMYKLYLDVVDKHEMSFELLPKKFFVKVSQNMPGRTKFFLWKLNGKLVAFLFCLLSKDTCVDYYIGLDYSIAHKYYLYFFRFRDTLNWCIRHKIKKYEMGNTGYEPKRRLGMDFAPCFIYSKLRNGFFRPLFSFFCQFLKFENFDPDLKEVKKRMHLKSN